MIEVCPALAVMKACSAISCRDRPAARHPPPHQGAVMDGAPLFLQAAGSLPDLGWLTSSYAFGHESAAPTGL